MVQVLVHLPKDEQEAGRIAKRVDPAAEWRVATALDSEVERGSRLTFDLSIPGLKIRESRQSLVWRGRPQSVQFEGVVPAAHRGGTVIGTVIVSQDSVPFGHMKFKMTVGAETTAAAPPPTTTPAEGKFVRYRKAFVSYASEDRNEVLKRVQMLGVVGMDYFQDLLSLDPGERWERALYKHIDDSDLFLLFWSTSAKRSKWVLKEVRHALERKAKDEEAPPEIVPVILKRRPFVKPPRDLAGLHFNDKTLYFIEDDQG